MISHPIRVSRAKNRKSVRDFRFLLSNNGIPTQLFHVSDQPDITEFVPRPAPTNSTAMEGRMFWAIDAAHLPNYLFPRDCPRVCFAAAPGSSPTDVERLIRPTTARRVIAIESGWLERVLNGHLFLYELPPAAFTLFDASAGYYIARHSVIPNSVRPITDLLHALLELQVELRITLSLWPLCDAIVASTLEYSCIRMRNTQPRVA